MGRVSPQWGVTMANVVSDFNDAVSGGGAIRLHHLTGGGYDDVIPFVPQNVLAGTPGQYYALDAPTSLASLDASKYSRVSPLPRVDNVRLVDATGATLQNAPRMLTGCFLEFDVRGIPRGDVYRVEVFPDPNSGPAKDIDQISAGTHVSAVQHFKAPLGGGASREVALSIHRVDAETAKRDPNIDQHREWEDYLKVR